MDCIATRLPYRQTNSFSKTVLDYLDHTEGLKPFYTHLPTVQGIQKAIDARKEFATNRELLVQELKKQYKGVPISDKINENIELLLSADTFTITTAHQNNIFTGPLYFIYKIVHAIKMADQLKQSLPSYNFVPVFYIGSEDADLDELNHIYIGGEKLQWNTTQKGAVGRMKVDKELVKLIGLMEGQLLVLPHGKEIISSLKEFYKEGATIQDVTFRLVNSLFAAFGLLVLLPDNALLKKQMTAVFEDDLFNQTASGIVEKTAEKLEGAGYKVQASPREINLFYLINDKRERIEVQDAKYEVRTLGLQFSKEEILKELEQYPERFSANVILRGAFQETVLPNIAFIGGGGELAYWLELKNVFAAVNIPYPVLLLRNSFLLLKSDQANKLKKLGFTDADLFKDALDLLNTLVKRESENQLNLTNELQQAKNLYAQLQKISGAVDQTLSQHVTALEKQALKKLTELEKKILRAERFKYDTQQKQITKLKQDLFPANSLQERVDNFSLYYATHGKTWLTRIYDVSTGLNSGFGVVTN